MDSALTPREIQSRIRAGESPDDVARAAGVPVDGIEGYAAPVLAEREHMAEMARAAQCRRGNGRGPAPLGEAARARLGSEGIDADSADWDAWREEDRADRHWTVQASYRIGSTVKQARFDFDPRGRFAVAANDDARWLLGEEPPRPRTPIRRADPDAEPTVDLNDEMALVRAVQPGQQPIVGGGAALAEVYGAAESSGLEDAEDELEHTGLTKIDGVYELVPNPTSDMDVLYDMLSGFDEDSVHVYADLNQPIAVGGAEDGRAGEGGPDEDEPDGDRAGEDRPDDRSAGTGRDRGARGAEEAPAGAGGPERAGRARAGRTRPGRGRTAKKEPAGEHPAGQGPVEPEQDPLPEAAPEPKKKSPRKRKGHRASVPSWDEIMFGGSKGPDDSDAPLR